MFNGSFSLVWVAAIVVIFGMVGMAVLYAVRQMEDETASTGRRTRILTVVLIGGLTIGAVLLALGWR